MHGHNRNAFTLIELLVVMAVMAVFLGGIGMALSGGEGTMAVQTGQRTMTTMLSVARSQAVVNQTKARLVIHVDPPDPADISDPRREKYLRFIAILIDGENGWEPINEGTTLPNGVYVVPPLNFDTGPAMPTNFLPNNWPLERTSIIEPATMQFTWPGPSSSSNPEYYMYIEFDARGTTAPTTEINGTDYARRIVLAPARVTPTYPEFEEDGDMNILGGMVRRNGSFTLINNAAAFPTPNP